MSAPLSQIYGLTVNIDKCTVPLAVLNQSPPLFSHYLIMAAPSPYMCMCLSTWKY